MDRLDGASMREITGGGFPVRDFLVARTYEPRADAAATLVVVGSPLRRRPAAMPGGNTSVLVRRFRLCRAGVDEHPDRPILVFPRQSDPALRLGAHGS
jgi:hypothetical protein